MFVTMFATMIAAGALGFTTLSGQLLDMQEQIGGLRVETHEEIGGLRVEMHEEIDGLRVEMHEEIDGLRTEMREEIGLRAAPRSQALRPDGSAIRADGAHRNAARDAPRSRFGRPKSGRPLSHRGRPRWRNGLERRPPVGTRAAGPQGA